MNKSPHQVRLSPHSIIAKNHLMSSPHYNIVYDLLVQLPKQRSHTFWCSTLCTKKYPCCVWDRMSCHCQCMSYPHWFVANFLQCWVYCQYCHNCHHSGRIDFYMEISLKDKYTFAYILIKIWHDMHQVKLLWSLQCIKLPLTTPSIH